MLLLQLFSVLFQRMSMIYMFDSLSMVIKITCTQKTPGLFFNPNLGLVVLGQKIGLLGQKIGLFP